MTSLLKDLLAKPVGPNPPQEPAPRPDQRPTQFLEITGGTATVQLVDKPGTINQGLALEYLKKDGQNPDDWEPIYYKRTDWTTGLDQVPQEAVKFTFKRKTHTAGGITHEEMDALIDRAKTGHPHEPKGATGGGAFIIHITDEQLGRKDDHDAPQRVIGYIHKAAHRYQALTPRPDEIALTFGGDQIEGYNSQGGRLQWRNGLTLTEMLRVSRRVTLHAVQTLAPLTDKLTVATCASNHGQAVRVGDKQATRADDDHGIETLIAVADACRMNPDAYSHVTFLVPHDDSGVVAFEAGATTIGLAHGHDWRPGKHWDWLSQSSMSRHPIGSADVLLAGHYHSLRVEEQSGRTFIQGPSCEKRSTWFRNSTGIEGHPGVITFRALNGHVHDLEVIR